jgi:tetratricopeptide (TPR) repeat protein
VNFRPELIAEGILGTGTLAAAILVAALPFAFAAPLLYRVFHKATQLRSKGYSRRAIQSVGVWIIALSLTLAAAILASFGWYGNADVNNYRLLSALVGAGAWSTAIIGIVFSLQGLRETDRKLGKNRRYGRSYAVGGCSANGMLLVLLLGGGGYYASRIMPTTSTAAGTGPSVEAATIFAQATVAAKEALENSPHIGPVVGGLPTPLPPSATATGTAAATPPPALVASAGPATTSRAWFGQLFGSRAGDDVRDPGPDAIDFPAFNLRLRRPGSGWLRVDPSRAGQDALLVYDQPARKLRFLVTAERPGVERGSDPQPLVERVQQRLREAVPSFTFTPATSFTFSKITGVRFTGDGTRDGEACAASAWVAVHNGYWYQLLLVGSGEKSDKLKDEAARLFGLFEPTDPAATARAPEVVLPTREAELSDVGVRVPALGASWSAWPDFATTFPTADFGAKLDARTGFVICTVRTDDAAVDRLAAASALLTSAGQSYERATSRPPRKRAQSKIDGDEYEWTPADSRLGGHRIARVFTVPRAAYLLLGWSDEEGSPGHDVLRQALDAVTFAPVPSVEIAKLTALRRTQSAQFYAAVGDYFLRNSQPATAEQQYRTAQKFAPDDVAILTKVVEACFVRGRYPEALASLDAKPEVTNRSDPLRIRKADALAEIGRRDDALKQYAAVFRDGYLNDAAFTRYLMAFESAGKFDDALIALGAYRTRRNNATLTALEGRLLSRRGDNLAASRLLERQIAAAPAEPEPAYVLADVYRRLQRPLDSLQVIEKLIASGGGTATAFYWRGLAEYDLHRTRSAQESFTSAHRLDPSDVAIKQMLDLTSGLMGEAQSYQARAKIDPVPLPKSIAEAVPSSPMPDGFSLAPAYYLDYVTAYSHRSGEDFRRTEFRTFRVLNAQGVDELNVLSISYDPLSEEAFVNRLDVFDEAGRPVASGDPATYYVVDAASIGAALRERRLEMPVPGLRPNYRVELVATVRSFVDRPRFPYLHLSFGGRYPVRRQALFLATDAQQLAWGGSLAESVRRDAAGVWWQATDLAAEVREPFSPETAEIAPTLFVAGKQGTWQSEVLSYVAEISDRRTVPPIVQQTAQQMTQGLEGTEAKLQALAAFAQREIAYRRVPFGIRNRVPQSPDRTLANRFGDSKDVSLMLAMMLASVGVDTRIALVNTTEPVQPNLMTLDQFDHMVVFIPQGEGGRVIDACDKEADARLPVPLRLAGRDCLVIDEKNARLVRLNRPSLDSYRASIDRRVEFDAAGRAKVREAVTFFDYYAAAMRGRLRSVAASERTDYWQSLLRESGATVVLGKWQVDRLDDLTQPLVVTYDYEVDRALISQSATTAGDASMQEWVGTLPAPFEATQLLIGADEARRHPLDFPYAVRITSATEITPPPGLPVPDAATMGEDYSDDLLKAVRTVRTDQSSLKVSFELTRSSGRYPPNRYEDFRKAARRARAAASPTLRFVPTK